MNDQLKFILYHSALSADSVCQKKCVVDLIERPLLMKLYFLQALFKVNFGVLGGCPK